MYAFELSALSKCAFKEGNGDSYYGIDGERRYGIMVAHQIVQYILKLLGDKNTLIKGNYTINNTHQYVRRGDFIELFSRDYLCSAANVWRQHKVAQNIDWMMQLCCRCHLVMSVHDEMDRNGEAIVFAGIVHLCSSV